MSRTAISDTTHATYCALSILFSRTDAFVGFHCFPRNPEVESRNGLVQTPDER